MLRLPQFEYHEPQTLAETCALLAAFSAEHKDFKLIAGGTDLLPNMKHEILTPAHLISLQRLNLAEVRPGPDEDTLGAMTTIEALSTSAYLAARYPALVEACGQIAGPQLRRMGTLGGNLCLDTRCVYINQSYFWRQSLGFCLKKDGTLCHVVAGGKNCVAAASNDTALPLLLYGASLEITSPRGVHQIPLSNFYGADGIKNNSLLPDEILTRIILKRPASNVRVGFEKLRLRRSIDFPLLNVALLLALDAAGRIDRLELAMGAMSARPKHLVLSSHFQGEKLCDALGAKVAERAYASCKPLTNLSTDPAWRRNMVRVLVKRLLSRL